MYQFNTPAEEQPFWFLNNTDELDDSQTEGYLREFVMFERPAAPEIEQQQEEVVWKLTEDELCPGVKTDPIDIGNPSLMGASVALPIEGYQDAVEAVKYERELAQQLKDMPSTNTPRRVSLEWRHKLIVAVVVALGMLPSSMAEKSTPEAYADATSTLMWAFGCLLVLYQFSSAIKIIAIAIVASMTALTKALVGTIDGLTTTLKAFTSILQAISGVLPLLVITATDALKWWKYNMVARTAIQGLGVFGSYCKLPFQLYGFCRGKEMKFEGRTFKPQEANKYGVLASVVMATLMFVCVPLWGFSKSFKYWEPIMRVLEKLPYVTWLIDWLKAYFAGEASVDDIPTSVKEFAEGKEVPVSGCSLFDTPVSNGSSHKTDSWRDEHDMKECYAREILEQDCDDECFCTCHCSEETRDAKEEIAENDGAPESRAGLGSSQQNSTQKRQKVFVKSEKEPIESRVERLKALGMYQKFVPASDSEKGKERVKDETPVEEEVPSGKAEEVESNAEPKSVKRTCRDCSEELTAFDIAVCKKCSHPEKMEKQMFGISLREWFEVEAQALHDRYAPVIDDARNWLNQHKVAIATGIVASIALIAMVAKSMMKDDVPIEFTPECIHYSNCPTMPKQVDAFEVCNKSCGGQNCTHFVGCTPVKESSHGAGSQKVRWTPPKVSRPRQRGRKLDHPISSGDEMEFDEPWEEDVVKGRRASRAENTKWKQMASGTFKEQEWSAEGKIAQKSKELGMKYFPVRRDPAHVAATNRTVRRARTRQYAYYPADAEKVRRINEQAAQVMTAESLLGKAKLTYSRIATNVFKFFQNGEFTSTAAIIGDKVHVPLHSHIDGATRKIVNTAASAEIRGDIIPTSEDGGVFFHYGVVKPSALTYRCPRNEAVMLVSFSSADQVEPSISVGFASTDGLANYASEPGDCGGLVVAVSDGAVVGTHIAGGQEVNRFEPVTEDKIKRWKASAPVLASMLFQ